MQINKLIVPLNKNIHCRASFYHSRQLCRSMNPKHAKPSFGALGPTKHWGRKGRVYSIKLLIYPHSNIGDTSFMVAKQTTEAFNNLTSLSSYLAVLGLSTFDWQNLHTIHLLFFPSSMRSSICDY